jgi:hypothetical protein
MQYQKRQRKSKRLATSTACREAYLLLLVLLGDMRLTEKISTSVRMPLCLLQEMDIPLGAVTSQLVGTQHRY